MKKGKYSIVSFIVFAGLLIKLSLVSPSVAQTKIVQNHGGKTINLKSLSISDEALIRAKGAADTLNNDKVVRGYNTIFSAAGEDIIAAWFVCPQDLKIKACGIDAGDNALSVRAELKIVMINKEWTEKKLNNAGSENLGYWISNGNTNKIFPFSGDVTTSKTWVNNSAESNNPFGSDLWSDNGIGASLFPVDDKNSKSYQWIEMNILNNEPELKKGDVFAVCIKNSELRESNNTFGIMATSETGYGVFKFYANGRTPGDLTTAGWWKRDFLVNVVVAVEITGDASPMISDIDILETTLSKEARSVTAKIVDQNPSGGTAGVGNAYLQYFLNKDTTWKDISMTKSSGDIYTGNIPGQQTGTKVTYRIKAGDVNGNISISGKSYSYYVFGPTPGVKSLLVFNGMLPEEINQFPMNSYFVLDESGKVNNWTHDVWPYGALTSELVNNYTNIFEICSSDNSGENIKYNQGVIRTWLAQNGNHNYALSGQEWLGAKDGFIDKDYSAGSFEYDILGINHSYNDVTDLNASIKPSRMFAVQNSLLGNELYKKFQLWGSDSLQYDPYYELNKTENWLDGFDVVSDQQIDMQVETRVVNGTTQKINLACLTHRTLSNGNKIAFFSFDPIAVNTKSPKTNSKYFRFGTSIQAPQVKILQWFNLITEIEEVNTKIPVDFKLHQNYPNPFNPSTTIRYELPHKSYVNIKVFDVLGNEIKTLVDKEQNIGRYELQFNAQNLPSGIYYYKMTTEHNSITKKLMLIK